MPQSRLRPCHETDVGVRAATAIVPLSRLMVNCCSSSSEPGGASERTPSATRTSSPNVVQIVPSNSPSAAAARYSGLSLATVNNSTLPRLTNRERMLTSGLTTSVTSPCRLRVSSNALSPAPGSCGATATAPVVANSAQATAAGSVDHKDSRRLPIQAESSRECAIRRAATVRIAAPTQSAATSTLLRSTPRAEVKMNTTPAGTTASARPNARKANESASQAQIARAVVAAIAKLPWLGTGDTARGNWCQTSRMLLRNWSTVSPVGRPNRVELR